MELTHICEVIAAACHSWCPGILMLFTSLDT